MIGVLQGLGKKVVPQQTAVALRGKLSFWFGHS